MNEIILEKLECIERYVRLSSKSMLSLDDVALLTGLSKGRLYKMTCTHQIPYYKPSGKRIYFDKEEVEKWMRQNRISTDQEVNQKASNYSIKGAM